MFLVYIAIITLYLLRKANKYMKLEKPQIQKKTNSKFVFLKLTSNSPMVSYSAGFPHSDEKQYAKPFVPFHSHKRYFRD